MNNIVGMMLAFAHRWDEAVEQYRKTIDMDPTVWLPHLNLGRALEEMDKTREAVEEYLKAGAFSGTSAEALMELRTAYEACGLRGFRESNLKWIWRDGKDGTWTLFI